jgi:hypothetical protein
VTPSQKFKSWDAAAGLRMWGYLGSENTVRQLCVSASQKKVSQSFFHFSFCRVLLWFAY